MPSLTFSGTSGKVIQSMSARPPWDRIAVGAPIVIAPSIARGCELSSRIATITITIVLKHRAVPVLGRCFSGIDKHPISSIDQCREEVNDVGAGDHEWTYRDNPPPRDVGGAELKVRNFKSSSF